MTSCFASSGGPDEGGLTMRYYQELAVRLRRRYLDDLNGVLQRHADVFSDCNQASSAITDLLVLNKKNERTIKAVENTIKAYQKENDRLKELLKAAEARAEKAERERDAFKARYCSNEPCNTCANYEINDCDGDCLSCTADCPCNKCEDHSLWEWDGGKKEE